ncbi:MAG: hypothetical protein GY822_15775 [Deltaproteobacteria bacterium]|nr:hypothetical protein [Deltaproteobacteria bacterium]
MLLPVNTLQEELSQRLETFALDQVFTRADAACELFMALTSREGGLSLDGGGHLLAGERRLAGSMGEEILELVTIGSGVFCGVFGGGRSLNGIPKELFNDVDLPNEVNTVCMLRGESFIGSAQLGGKAVVISAKPLRLGAEVVGVVVSGLQSNEANSTLLGLSNIETELIHLAEEMQGDRQRTVTDFVKTIRSIAKRIHLLALNASILSAQAGEHGRGFAVVAREIGDLAERTRLSTQELEQELLGRTDGAPQAERRRGSRAGLS